MNNPSFHNARFLLPVLAIVVIVGLVSNSKSDSNGRSEIVHRTGQSSATSDAQNADEPQVAANVGSRAVAAEQKMKTEADRLAAATKAKADAAEKKATAEAGQSAATAESKATQTVANVTVASVGDSSIPQYVVRDGMVDKATYNGYRRFHGTCHACHGQDAAGGSFAPSLVESLKKIDYDLFHKTVVEGRIATGATGSASVMPAFSNDPNVMKHLDDIYRYLAGRSDGAIGPGRPERLR
ncbi:MAG: cytochrome c [Granulosicoccus sp.]